FQDLMTKIKHKEYQPTIMNTETKDFFYLFPLAHVQGKEQQLSGISSLLEAYFHGKAERDQVKQRALDLFKFLTREKRKNENKIKKLYQTLAVNEQAEEYKLFGELLTAYMHQLKRGEQEVSLPNYYDPEGTQ